MQTSTTIMIILNITLFVLLLFMVLYKPDTYKIANHNHKNIVELTDHWVNVLNTNDPNNPQKLAALFCSDGSLVGTVSQTMRTGIDIERYFDYFALLKGIKVIDKKYNIQHVADDVYLNTAFMRVTWDDLDGLVVSTRMSFLFRGDCIFQLHSSQLPDVNDGLRKVS